MEELKKYKEFYFYLISNLINAILLYISMGMFNDLFLGLWLIYLLIKLKELKIIFKILDNYYYKGEIK